MKLGNGQTPGSSSPCIISIFIITLLFNTFHVVRRPHLHPETMIQGLEYEPPDDGVDPSYYGSPSSQSVSSVNLLSPASPSSSHQRQQYHRAQQEQQFSHRSPHNDQSLHRRRPRSNNVYDDGYGTPTSAFSNTPEDDKYAKRRTASRLARKLDIFPKTERDYTVRTDRGGQLTAFGYALMTMLILAEWSTYRNANRQSLEHIVVDTRCVSTCSLPPFWRSMRKRLLLPFK